MQFKQMLVSSQHLGAERFVCASAERPSRTKQLYSLCACARASAIFQTSCGQIQKVCGGQTQIHISICKERIILTPLENRSHEWRHRTCTLADSKHLARPMPESSGNQAQDRKVLS